MSQQQLLLSRARSATLSRDFELAARLYRQLLRDDRNNVSILNELGNLYIKSERDELALPVFRRIAELDKKNLDVYITLGGIYRRLKRYDESVAVLEQSLLINGDNPQVLYNLGFTYKIMGDTENAISFFEDTIEKNPDDVLAYNHIGTIYAQKGEHEKAVQSYLRGLNVDANHPVLLMNIAKSYEELGDYKKACEAYSHALRSRPFWTDAITDYSHLLVKLNRVNDARTLVTRACSANPQDEKLKECLDYVEQFVVINADNNSGEAQTGDGLINAELSTEEEKSEVEEADDQSEESETTQDLPESEFEEVEAEEPDPPEENSLNEESEAEEEADFEDLKQENEEDFDFDAFGDEEKADDLLEDESLTEEDDFEPQKLEEADGEMAETDAVEPDGEVESADADLADCEPESADATDELESDDTTDELESDDTTDELDATENQGGEDSLDGELDSAVEEMNEPALLEIEADDFNPFAQFCTDTDDEPCDVEELTDGESEIEVLDDAENTDPKLSLFLKLRQLLEYLPEEKLLEYQSSEARLMLDYLVLHLSGHKGLLKTAFELKDSAPDSNAVKSTIGQADDQSSDSLQENPARTKSLNSELLKDGIKVVEELVQKLPDKNLVYAMEQQLKKLEM